MIYKYCCELSDYKHTTRWRGRVTSWKGLRSTSYAPQELVYYVTKKAAPGGAAFASKLLRFLRLFVAIPQMLQVRLRVLRPRLILRLQRRRLLLRLPRLLRRR